MHGAIHRYLLIRKWVQNKSRYDIYNVCTLFATEEDPFGLLHVLLSKAVYHVPYTQEQTNTYNIIIDMVMNLYSFMVLFFSMSKGYSFCLFKGVIVLSQFF